MNLTPDDVLSFRQLLICPDFIDVWAEIDDDHGNLGIPVGEGLHWSGTHHIHHDATKTTAVAHRVSHDI